MKAIRFTIPEDVRSSRGLPDDLATLVRDARRIGTHGPVENVEFHRRSAGVVATVRFRDGQSPSWAHGRLSVDVPATSTRLHNLLVEEISGEPERRAAHRATMEVERHG